MKFGAALTLIGLAGGLATLAATQGCGDSGSADDKGATSETGKTVPPAEGSPTTATDERAFAVDALFVGDADRAGTASATAWKKFGYNLDGHITTVTDSNSPDLKTVCKRASGAQASVHQDGDEGTDNAFGSKILPLLQPFAPAVSKTATDAIRKGDFTVMLKVVGLTDDAAQTNTGLSGTLLVGGAFSEDGSKTPTFTTADDWPYIKDPQVALSDAYINKGVFVNGKGSTSVKLSVSISGQSLSLTINKAIISFKHNPATKSLDDGTIAGVLNVEEFITGVSSIAGSFSKDLCQGATVEGIKSAIRQAADILADGSQDPNKDCDGISVGIGFTAKQVGIPTKTVPEAPAPGDPCTTPADGGT